MNADLPVRPDLSHLKNKRVKKSQDRRTLILSLIGNLSFCWSNNESMFLYVIMTLLKVDEISAKIIFGTLNTTRARIDLIERLAVAHLKDADLMREMKRIIRIFNDCTRKRNEFIHCMFRLDEDGDITHTHSLRIQVQKSELQTGLTKEIDEKRIKQLVQTIKKLIKLNDDIWKIVPRLDAHMKAQQ